jgi:hypothetical protein
LNGLDETIRIGGKAEAQNRLTYDPENGIVASEGYNILKYWNIQNGFPIDVKKSDLDGFVQPINKSGTVGLMKDSVNNYSIFHTEKGKIVKRVPLVGFDPYIEATERYWDENSGKLYYYLNTDLECLSEDCQQVIWLLNDSVIGRVNTNNGEIIRTAPAPYPMGRLITNKSGTKAVAFNNYPLDEDPAVLHFTIWNTEQLIAEKTIKVQMESEAVVLTYSFSEDEKSLFALYRLSNIPAVINVMEIDLNSGKYTFYEDEYGMPNNMGDELAILFASNDRTITERGNLLIFQSDQLSIIADKNSKKIVASSNSNRGNAFNPSGTKFYTYTGPYLSVYEVSSGKLLYSIKSNDGGFVSIIFSNNDEYLIGSTKTKLLTYDGHSGKIVRSVSTETTVHIHSISSDLGSISGIAEDGSLQIWDLKTYSLKKNILKTGTEDFVNIIQGPGGKKVFYQTYDSEYVSPPKAYVFDLEKDSLIYQLEQEYPSTGKVIYSDSALLVILVGREFIYISDTVETLSFSRESNSIELSADGKMVVLSKKSLLYPDDITSVDVIEIESKKTVISLRGNIAKLSPDQKYLAVSDRENMLRVYDISTNSEVASYKPGDKNCTQIEFTGDGNHLIAFYSTDEWASSKDLYCFKIGQSEPLWEIKDLKGDQFTILSGDKFLVMDQLYFDGSLLILDLGNGEQVKKFRSHTFFADYSKNSKEHLLLFDEPTQKFVAYDLTTLTQNYSFDISIYRSTVNELVNTTAFYIEKKNMYETVVRRSSDQSILYTRVQLAGEDWLVYDEFYRYDGSPAAREQLHFVCGMEILDLNQMKDALYVPGLAEKKINNQEINYAKLNELDICSALPIIERLADPEDGGYLYLITPQQLALDHCEIYIENKLIKTIQLDELKKEKNSYLLRITTKDIEPHLIPGESNEIRVVAVVKKGQSELRSRGAIVHSILKAETTADVNLYAIMVGVNDYKADELDLQFPVKDALSLGASLEQSAKKLLGDEHVFMYRINSDVKNGNGFNTPEREGIRKAFEDIGKKAKAEDIVLVFFAGHGVMQGTTDKKFTFLTAEASRENLIGISTTDLQSWLSPEGPYKMLANKTILIFDACNSGQASKELMELAARNDEDSKRIRQVEDLKDKSGMFILAASAPNQSAYELPQYQQGLLTYALLKTLKYNPSILDDNQFLNVQKWFLESEAELKRIIESLGQQQDAQPFGSSNIRIGYVDAEIQDSIHLAAEKPMVVCVNAEDINTEIDHLKLQEKVNNALNELNARGASSKVSYVSQGVSNANNIKLKYEIKGGIIICSVSLIKEQQRYLQRTIEVPFKNIDELVQKIIQLAEEFAK